MRSLPLEDSRTASDSEPLHSENNTLTQHGLQENDIQASSGFPSQGTPETPNPVLHGLEDIPTTLTPEGDEREQPNLRKHSQLVADTVIESVSVVASSPKFGFDGPEFNVVQTGGKSDGSSIAILPNGTHMSSLNFPSAQ